jgi:hypothetical protein
LRLRSALVRASSSPGLSHADPPLDRHGMADDTLPYAALVLRCTDRDHRSMFPRPDWRVRVLHLGFVSDRFQAVPFDTSIGIVRVFCAYSHRSRED